MASEISPAMALMSMRSARVFADSSTTTAAPFATPKTPSLGKKTSVSLLDALSYNSSLEQQPPAATSIAISSTSSAYSEDDDESSPIEYLENLFAKHGVRLSGRRSTKHVNQRQSVRQPCPTEVDSYDMETTRAVRANDLQALRELHRKGYPLDASNRYGESLLHIACRRGSVSMIKFMLLEAKVNPRVMDDMGRTAFHDTLWSSTPNFSTLDVLLKVLPPVGLLIQDVRGHTPFQYAPRKHWGLWAEYLRAREGIFVQWIVARKQLAAAHRMSQSQSHQQRILQQKLCKSKNQSSSSSPSKMVSSSSPAVIPARSA